MNKTVKNIIIYTCSVLLTWIVIDIVFQQSKMISGLHVQVNKVGTYFRPNIHLYSFNEGVGIQYTDSNGVMTFNPGMKQTWNLYGDSYIEALQVFQRHHFAQSLSTNKRITIQNFGLSSMNFESMYARYFQIKDSFPALQHIFFISSDDFDSDDIGDFLALPTFSHKDSLLENTSFKYKSSLKRTIESTFCNSSTLMLAKSDLRQIKNGQTQAIVFDKFYVQPKKENIYPNLVKPKRVIQLLRRLSKEPNIVFIYRGKLPMPQQYNKLFEKENIRVIDLEKAIASLSNSDDLYYHKVTKTHGHWNREAHEFIAQFLEDEL